MSLLGIIFRPVSDCILGRLGLSNEGFLLCILYTKD